MICGVFATSSALAYSPYTTGNVSTTYVQYFEDIVDKITPSNSYVMWRNGQNEYMLYYSQSLRLSGTTFDDTGNGTIVRMYTSGSVNNQWQFEHFQESGFQLTANKVMVYSNLGNYPSLNEGNEVLIYALLFVAITFGCCVLVRPIFKFVLRSRN